MYKVSELLSKPLISLYDAKVIGVVSNIIFDAKMMKGRLLVVVNDDIDDTNNKFIELKDIANLNYDAVVIKNSECLTNTWNTVTLGAGNPINCACYNQDGKYLGIVKDVYLENQKVLSLLIECEEYPANTLLSFSDKLLIFNDTGLPIKLKPTKHVPLKNEINGNQNVNIHNIDHETGTESNKKTHSASMTVNENNSALKSLPLEAQRLIETMAQVKIDLPTKIPQKNTLVSRTPIIEGGGQNQNYQFLIGKTLQKDIYSITNELILPQETVITDKEIEIARGNGKLVQLALHSL